MPQFDTAHLIEIWHNLSQYEQEALAGAFPVERQFPEGYWNNLEIDNLVTIHKRIGHPAVINITLLGKMVMEAQQEDIFPAPLDPVKIAKAQADAAWITRLFDPNP